MEAAKRYGTINLKGIYDKSSSILTEEESSSSEYQNESPTTQRRTSSPGEPVSAKKIVINARLSGSMSKD